ncbi:MAG: histidine triad nucleotide-binding protein [Paenibacillaceae bacterium]|nr:histidine triad nucleotide-binding protein [Paenibacillaceae bacterium]
MEPCIFCRIARGLLPCKKVYETDTLLAFHDIAPIAPVHILFIPKVHIPSFHELAVCDGALAWMNDLMSAVRIVADEYCLNGYRLVTNIGADGGQVVDHVHIHMLGGQPIGPMRVGAQPASID